jgi:demethylmenaquinone methyltransferase/2-methoxy-6-polyprenyl-1,4-benzoquinol methylase
MSAGPQLTSKGCFTDLWTLGRYHHAVSGSEPSSGVVWTDRDLAGDPHAAVDKADRVRRMFAAIAHRYDLNNRLHSFGRDQAWRRRAVALAQVGPSDDILDVACGTGDLAEAFADVGPASVTGLDFTPAMLDLARTKAARRPATEAPRPTYVEGDAMDLPFADATFDVVSIAFGIRNVADPGKALGEFRRVLRPGGRVVVLEFGEPSNRLLRLANAFYTRRVMPFTAALVAKDRTGAYRYLPSSVRSFSDPSTLAGLIKAARFEQVRSHQLTFGVCVAHIGRAG